MADSSVDVLLVLLINHQCLQNQNRNFSVIDPEQVQPMREEEATNSPPSAGRLP